MIEIVVEDEGAGIPEPLREKVFERFFRGGERTLPDRQGGIGMGLAIAKGIVEAHGGEIRIENGASGRGSRFTFTVPVGDEDGSRRRPVTGQSDRYGDA